uniref:Uncharacterized protein n=1 Tax=Candidatus Kentrum sp. LPFa TaxID=2126335 RepID=A0A450XY59_9GAMM|nr:MAG: hypothetical protein BECKLPF1236A_GA0070988_102592 [Candidatus Kentron sp. LPFa]VFK34206.1 MAG: hypothetical protein BECKLPF1236C_GA0070990_102522 [Candidatus Kentron sp. LPFa]
MNEGTGKANGWDSMWQRFMDRVFPEIGVERRFTKNDPRAEDRITATARGSLRIQPDMRAIKNR